ncbi:MAG: hypothetical protein ABIR05_00430 [Luteimonas sp.]
MDWIPAISTTSALALALWLARNLITTRLAKSVQYSFDEKLEGLRSALRKGEEGLRSEIAAKASEIQSLRSGALTNIAARQGALNQRRIEAIEQIWASVTSLTHSKLLANYLAVLNVEAMTKAVQSQEKASQLLDIIGSGFDPKSIDHSSATKARPFVSPLAWAIYSAIQAIAGHTLIRWHAMKSGIESQGFMDEGKIKELIKSALPYLSDYVDKHGAVIFHYTVDALENELLAEMRRMLSGVEDDRESVQRASEILKHSNELMQANAQSATAT